SFMQVLNRRDHRKILVVDDLAGYFGGMNIVDQTRLGTVERAKAHGLPASAGWRDVHVRLRGPLQEKIAAAFARLWPTTRTRSGFRWPRLRPLGWPIKYMLADTSESVYFFESRPGWPFRTPLRVFLPLIRRARQRITVSMAYFLPYPKLLRAL